MDLTEVWVQRDSERGSARLYVSHQALHCMMVVGWGCPRISARICMDRETRMKKPDVDTCMDTQPTVADERHQTLAHRLELAYQTMWEGPVGCVSGVLSSISGTLRRRTLGAIDQEGRQPLSGLPATLHREWMPRKDAKESRDRWSYRLNGLETRINGFFKKN